LTALALANLVGCQTNSEYVEAELRHQCKQVRELEQRVASKDAEIETLKSTVNSYQVGFVKPADAPESIYRETAVSRLSLSLMTGGKDADLDGRDDGVQVVLTPLDYDGDAFKCPGTAVVRLFETLPTGVKRPLSETAFPPERLRTSWRSTLLGQGYHLVVPWAPAPRETKLRTAVEFQTVDGRKFEVEKDFEVSLDVKQPPRKPGAVLEPDAERIEPIKPAAPPESKPESQPESKTEAPTLDGNVERAFVKPEPPPVEETAPTRSTETEIIKLPSATEKTRLDETGRFAPGDSKSELPSELPTELAGAPLPAPKSTSASATTTSPIRTVAGSQPATWPTYRWNDLVKRNNFFANRAQAQAAQ
jgi:hypothetical protein